MNAKDVIKKKLAEIEADELLEYAPANVAVNAPLALAQVELETKVRTLKWVLKQLEDGE